MRIWLVSLGLFFILVPTHIFSEILWQDDFDDYYDGMPLEESPYWEKTEHPHSNSDYLIFLISTQEGDDLWLWGNETNIYKAVGGAVDADMKVSVSDVYHDVGVSYWGWAGVLTRLSDDGSCYGAFLSVSRAYYQSPDYSVMLVRFDVDYDEFISFCSIDIPEPIDEISIMATGDNPVHISAWFDGYNLTHYDYNYKYDGEYGGVYSEGTLQWDICMDNFIEESVPDNIQSTSLGRIKSLMAD